LKTAKSLLGMKDAHEGGASLIQDIPHT